MTIVIFALGLLLVVAGFGGLAASFSLLPTDLGLLYGACGVILITGGVVTLAIGVAVRRLDVLTSVMRAGQFGEHAAEFASALAGAPHEADLSSHEADLPPHEADSPHLEAARAEAIHAGGASPALEDEAPLDGHAVVAADERLEEASEEPINENRAGHVPTIAAIEQALAEPEGPPALVGHYSAGGANYKIFSDGSIEAEMETGAFRFASMEDFKAYLAGEEA
jgi:hypothetical protein